MKTENPVVNLLGRAEKLEKTYRAIMSRHVSVSSRWTVFSPSSAWVTAFSSAEPRLQVVVEVCILHEETGRRLMPSDEDGGGKKKPKNEGKQTRLHWNKHTKKNETCQSVQKHTHKHTHRDMRARINRHGEKCGMSQQLLTDAHVSHNTACNAKVFAGTRVCVCVFRRETTRGSRHPNQTQTHAGTWWKWPHQLWWVDENLLQCKEAFVKDADKVHHELRLVATLKT